MMLRPSKIALVSLTPCLTVIITFAEEVMFWGVFICLFVFAISPKLTSISFFYLMLVGPDRRKNL